MIELILVVAIVALLASIAFPAYTSFTRQANRTDASNTMQLAARSLERCYARRLSYANCNVDGTIMNNGSTMQTPNLFYTITFTIPDARDYTLTAVPIQAPQTTDTQCAQFTISSSGAQAAPNNHGSDNTTTCWGANGTAGAGRSAGKPGD